MTERQVARYMAQAVRARWEEMNQRPPDLWGPLSSDHAIIRLGWTTDLTSEEEALWDWLVVDAATWVQHPFFDDDEREALQPDIVGLETYLALPSPTQTQDVLAIKALIRILRAVVRS